MKKFLTITLSIVMLLSIAVTSGCKKSVFDGNYEKVEMLEGLRAVEEINASISWDKGYSIDYYSNKDFSSNEVFIKAKMTTSPFDNKAVGEWDLKEINAEMSETDKEETTKITKYLYDGIFTYKTIDVDGKTQKTKGTRSSSYWAFNDIVSKLRLDDRIVKEIRDFLENSKGQLQEGNFYLDENDETLKLKIEGKQEKLNVVFDKKLNIIGAAKYEYLKTTKNTLTGEKYQTKKEFTIEKWEGEISTPSNLDEYIDVGENLKL